MILYFSATGNTLLVARAIQKATGDEMHPIKEYIDSKNYAIESDSPVVIVSPIHVWKVPDFIMDYLKKAEISGTKDIYFVVTCRREAGNTDKTLEHFCAKKGWNLRGIGVIKMPFGYLMGQEIDDEKLSKKIIKGSIQNIKDICAKIANGEYIDYTAGRTGYKVTVFSKLYRVYYVNAGSFRVNKNLCDGCGLCRDLCPMHSIYMKDNHPAWKVKCSHCTSCINNCPKKAIEYGQVTKGSPRYHCPYETLEEAEADDSQ